MQTVNLKDLRKMDWSRHAEQAERICLDSENAVIVIAGLLKLLHDAGVSISDE